jgi:hypothetical protein
MMDDDDDGDGDDDEMLPLLNIMRVIIISPTQDHRPERR